MTACRDNEEVSEPIDIWEVKSERVPISASSFSGLGGEGLSRAAELGAGAGAPRDAGGSVSTVAAGLLDDLVGDGKPESAARYRVATKVDAGPHA